MPAIKRLLIILAMLVCAPLLTHAAPIHVSGQSCGNNNNTTGVTSLTCVFPNPVGAGADHLLWLCVHQYIGAIQPQPITWSGDSGTFVTEIVDFRYTGNPLALTCAYVHGTGGGSATITATFFSGAQFPVITGDEFSGVNGSVDVIDTLGATGTGTLATSQSIVTTQNGDLVLGVCGNGSTSTISVGSGYTAGASRTVPSGTTDFQEYQVQGSAGALTATCGISPSDTWGAHIISFFASAQPAALPTNFPYIPIVQVGLPASGGTTCQFKMPVTTGDYLITYSGWETGSGTPSVTDTLSTSYTQAVINTGNAVKIAVYSGTASSPGSNTITFSEASAAFQNVHCIELAPTGLTLTVDASGTNFLANHPIAVSTPAVTTTQYGDFIYTAYEGSNLGSEGMAQLPTKLLGQTGASDGGAQGYLIGTLPGAYNTVWINGQNGGGGNSTNVAVAIVAFKATSAIAITSPAALPDGYLSTPYNYTLLATGGTGPYTWSITSGALQSGLSLNASTGQITGTPTVGPQNSITFHVTDGSNTANLSATLKVSTAPNTITLAQSNAVRAGPPNFLAFGSNVTAGNLIVVTRTGGQSVASPSYCTDTLGTNLRMVVLGGVNINSNSLATVDSIWVGTAPSSGADTVTCGSAFFAIAELANAVSFGGEAIATTSYQSATSPIVSNTITAIVPNEAIIAVVDESDSEAGTFTPTAPLLTLGGATSQPSFGYRIVTTATGYTPTFTFSGDCASFGGGNNGTACGMVAAAVRAIGGPTAGGPSQGHFLIDN